jgi:hypothetical protein
MILNSPISCPVKGLEEITGLRAKRERVSKWADQLDVAGRDEVGKSEELRGLIIDMPLACLCIFVDGLVELQLDGVGSALFKSVKFQFLASEDDFITFRPVFQFVS